MSKDTFSFRDLSPERALILLILLVVLMVSITLTWIYWIRIESQEDRHSADQSFYQSAQIASHISEVLDRAILRGQALQIAEALATHTEQSKYQKELTDIEFSISQSLSNLRSGRTLTHTKGLRHLLVNNLASAFDEFHLSLTTFLGEPASLPRLLSSLEKLRIVVIQLQRLDSRQYEHALELASEIEHQRYQYFLASILLFLLISGYISILLFKKIGQMVRQRMESEDQIRSLLNSTAQAIFGIDNQGLFTFCNTTCLNLLGFESEVELLGRNMDTVVCHSRIDMSAHPQNLDSTPDLAGVFANIHVKNDIFRKADNTTIPVEYWAYPVISHAGAIKGRVIAFFDITQKLEIEKQLSKYQSDLEALVQERTEALNQTHSELVKVSHRAGMSEIATGVLHNVGNVLTSINIGTDVSTRLAKKLLPDGLKKVVDLLNVSASGQTKKDKELSDYLISLISTIDKDKQQLVDELTSLSAHVDNIKKIIATQQRYAVTFGLETRVDISHLVKDSLAINVELIKFGNIKTPVQYKGAKIIKTEQHKVLQILINLISNAAHALASKPITEPEIMITTHWLSSDLIIEVKDNGPGIKSEIIDRIFNLGTTTRKDGHGLGLHISGTLAQELGGKLIAKNNTPGPGTNFTLTLPVSKNTKSNKGAVEGIPMSRP